MNNQMNAYNSVLQFLRANNLREAEMAMVKECQQKNIALQSMEPATPSKILNSNPTNHVYNKEYKVMYLYIRESLDIEKFELVQFTFPIFANMFIECIEKNLINAANAFFRENEGYQEFYYKMYLTKLRCILNPQILNESQIYSRLRNNKYNLYINKKTFQNFASFLSINCRLIFNIIQNHFNVMTYTDFKDLKIYTSSNPYIEQSQVNVMPIKYGVENVLKKPMFLEPFRKKKKLEDDCINPDISRIPRPENSQLFKIYQEKLALNKEKRYNEYSPYTAMYTIMNGGHVITITVFSDDFSLILCGLLNGNIHAWTVGEANIKTMKPMFQLNQVDPTDNINIYDKIKRHLNNGQSHEKFIGHSDRVTGIATCMFRNLLISSSMDGTVRLWSLDVMHCISVYISKYGSILDIDYGLEGVYFATCSSNMAHLWITQKKSPVRMFVGHFGNVERVKIHPNGNYVGTVSTDGSLRLWDVLDGICTRVYNFGSIIPTILSFSLNGIYVVVGAFDGSIYLWNLSSPVIAAILKSHSSLICGLSFDRNSNILTSCSSDDCIHTWSINEITKMKFNEYNSTSTHLIHKASTKGVNMNSLTYTHRNIVMITGFND